MQYGRIANRLKKFRRLSGYNQVEVAKLIGVTTSDYISRWEKGVATPSVRQLLALSVIYETLPHHLYPELLEETRRTYTNL